MAQFFQLTRRNVCLYLRDRGAVFSSLLGMIIIIGLMLFFLGDLYVEPILEGLADIPGHDASSDKDNASMLVLAWTAAGIIPINACMVTLSSLSCMIHDRVSGKSASIYTAPISRVTITASYITAAWISSVIICVITLTVAEAYLCTKGMAAYSFGAHLRIIGMIAVNSFTYSAVMYLIASVTRSEGAWSGIGTVIGTLVGFLGGIYLPIGQLGSGLVRIIKSLPVIYSTVMFRGIMTEELMSNIFADASADVITDYRSFMGIDLDVFGSSISAPGCTAVLLIYGAVFMAAGVAVTAFSKKKDR